MEMFYNLRARSNLKKDVVRCRTNFPLERNNVFNTSIDGQTDQNKIE